MKKALVSGLTALILHSALTAQPLKLPVYTVDQIQLPEEMNKQVCISGMKYFNNQLYLASERCPFIIVFDPEKKQISQTINISVPQEFEMEGMSSYKNKLYLVSENVAGVYQVDPATGTIHTVSTSVPLPPKSKSGDGIEGIAANERSNKFYLLRERNEDMTKSQIYTYNVKQAGETIALEYESMIELPLENAQWRYSDICVDVANNRLICLKSFSKGKLRQQYLESVSINDKGELQPSTLTNIEVSNFSDISNEYRLQDYSMNLEGITVSDDGRIFIVSDNQNGKASCDKPAKEKTVLLELKKN